MSEIFFDRERGVIEDEGPAYRIVGWVGALASRVVEQIEPAREPMETLLELPRKMLINAVSRARQRRLSPGDIWEFGNNIPSDEALAFVRVRHDR
jgi:hypothetical protein